MPGTELLKEWMGLCSVHSYRQISEYGNVSSFPVDLTDMLNSLVIRVVNWEFFVFVFIIYHENICTFVTLIMGIYKYSYI